MKEAGLSIVRGPPLSEEPGLGTLTLPGYIREVTSRYAEREALVLRKGGRRVRWTYAQLWDRSMEVARALVSIGVTKDSRVGILMTNRPEFLSATFGIALAGGVAVMLNTFATPAELDYMLRASSVSVVLFEEEVARKNFATILAELEPSFLLGAPGELRSLNYPFVRHLAVVGTAPPGGGIESWNNFLARSKGTPPEQLDAIAASVLPTDTAALFFSSGSTARPKGIINAHRGIAIQLWRWGPMFNLDGDIRSWTPNGFFWSGNFGTVLGTTLTVGGLLVLQRVFVASEALELMEAERVNFPMVWPHQAKKLQEAANWRDVDLSAIRFIDPKDPLSHHPSIPPSSWTDPQSYGSTETFTISTAHRAGTPITISDGTHGPPLPGNMVKIVDPMSGETLPIGQSGEIAVKGPTLMIGYLGVPIEEALDDEGFYHTGDAGRIDERGWVTFEGRLTSVIKTGGANVSAAEVDSVLMTFPGVKAASTVGVSDDALGELVVACIVPAEGAALEADAIQAFVRERLASYKTPRRILFFREDEMALTGSAKIKQGELRKLASQRLKREAANKADA